MSEKWTPGPWQITDGEGEGDLAITAKVTEFPGDEPWNIAEVYGGCNDRGEGDEIETLANANLIAAAPDLYEALAGLLGDADYGSFWSKRLDAASAALRKARGEMP